MNGCLDLESAKRRLNVVLLVSMSFEAQARNSCHQKHELEISRLWIIAKKYHKS